ncbi:hypothetical protein B0H34DRAFT_847462 [Crassisporium funariophilum]|nr:hypothetical protein B0H34DRAFT_847462 [Crassisporium funariophilum]
MAFSKSRLANIANSGLQTVKNALRTRKNKKNRAAKQDASGSQAKKKQTTTEDPSSPIPEPLSEITQAQNLPDSDTDMDRPDVVMDSASQIGIPECLGQDRQGEDIEMGAAEARPDTGVVNPSTTLEAALNQAHQAAESFENIEGQAQDMYVEYQTILACAKMAGERAIKTLTAAKAAKDQYDVMPLSGYKEAYLACEEKAARATLRSQKANKELEEITERLQKLIVAREEAEALSRRAADSALAEIKKGTPMIEDESEDFAIVDEPEDDTLPPNSPETARINTRGKIPTDTNKFFPIDKAAAGAALAELKLILKPKRNVKGHRYADPGLDNITRKRLESMKMLLWCYIDPIHNRSFSAAALHVAQTQTRGIYWAKKLVEWTRAYIEDRILPENLYGTWSESLIDHEDLRQELSIYLQSQGKYITAGHLVQYMAREDVKTRWKRKEGISISTAKRWMEKLGYRWTIQPSGQYVDGHEREDVVHYRQHVFLPAMAEYEARTQTYDNNGKEVPKPWPDDIEDGPRPFQDRTSLWYHDESTYYANDRRKVGWVHKDAKAVPRAKGEGPSLMVADFICADHGWCCSPDRSESARVLFKAGVERQGYFTNEDVRAQTQKAMDILDKHYPNDKHVFVFDNATTHLKRADDALSARKMPKNPSKPECNFGVERNKVGDDGKPVYGPDRKPVKEKVRMANGFCTRALRYMDGYRKGLNGAQAAYASKKYRGHRALPVGVLKEVENAGLRS